ncbi:TIGR04452 family lipoprotein [Leptospira saintgironsiae]|uniref:Lipoprotein n=1 Tax=Leptospira saintgironsiae TaxID=2023183 RepID=A0A2M9YBC1_9LEPT|nr:TIGR04452 family lipoprotein [Leptospira saintgironsiae]PJZ48861.1 hypothetical protein CH362_10445 [Leptospira saintgironsiae]
MRSREHQFMNKVVAILFILTALVANCNLIESTSLTKNSYTGGEAREKIRNAAFNAEGIFYEKEFGGYNGLVTTKAFDAALLISLSLDLDDSKYYKKDKVNDCVSDMEQFSNIGHYQAFRIFTLSENCRNFEEIGLLPK